MPPRNFQMSGRQRGPMSGPVEALVVSTDVHTSVSLTEGLLKNGLIPVCCSTLSEAQGILLRHPICLVLSDDRFPDGDFHDLLATVEASPSRAPVIIRHTFTHEPSRRAAPVLRRTSIVLF
jgi:DNA-binding NtrC family response regulator